MAEDKLAIEQIKRFSDLMGKYRSVFADDHQTISQYFLPQDSDINTTKTPGVTGYTDQIFDTTPIQAAQTYASGEYNWLTPPQQPWSEYEAPKAIRKKVDDDAVQWLGEASDDVMAAFNRSNFASVRASNALGVGVFGTDFVLFDEDEEQPGEFNFHHNKIGTYVFEEDYKGVADTTRREFEMTYRQICQKFNRPGDSIPEQMARAGKGEKGQTRKFKILHCIFPRKDSERLPNRKDGANKPFASVHISVDFKEVIRVGGYDEQPCMVPRFAKWGTNDVWGYGPAYLALPDARELNFMAQYMDAAAELMVNPPVLIPDNLEGDVDLRAGGTTTWDTNTPDGKPSDWARAIEYKLGVELMNQKRDAIRDAFFNQAFKLLNSEPLIDKKMTAYEISQRQAENLQGFTPVLGRRIPEFINPLMKRAFGIRFRAGKFGTPPDSLMQDLGGGRRGLIMPDILVTSRISDALKALKNRGTEETFQFMQPLMETKPELFDIFDMDKVMTEYAHNSGMAPDLIRPMNGPNGVAAIRAQRMRIQQQNRAAQMAEQLSKSGKNLEASPDWMKEQVQQQVQGKPGGKRAA
jgi:hypothetical protein